MSEEICIFSVPKKDCVGNVCCLASHRVFCDGKHEDKKKCPLWQDMQIYR